MKLFLIGTSLLGLCTAIHAAEPAMQSREIEFPGRALRNQAAFVHDGSLFVFGGSAAVDARDFSAEAFANEGFRIEIATGQTTRLNAPPIPLMSVNTLVGEHAGQPCGYAVGGISHDGQRMQLSDRVYRYSFADDTWTALKCRLPSPRTLGGLVQVDEQLLFFGGWEMDFSRPAGGGPPLYMTKQVVQIDPLAQTARVIGEMPRDRRSFAAIHFDDHVHLLGGLDGGFDYVYECDRYHPGQQTWSKTAAPHQTRAMANGVRLGQQMFLAGGFIFGEVPDDGGIAEPFAATSSLERFDPTTNKWGIVSESIPGAGGGSDLRMFVYGQNLLIWSIGQQDSQRATLVTIPAHPLSSKESQ